MKKFEKNDLFYNTIAALPSYKVVFYNGNVTVNDQISEGLNKTSASINLFEKVTTFTASLSENFLKNNYAFSASYSLFGTSSYNPQVLRNYIYGGAGQFPNAFTDYKTLKKIRALNNIFYKYSLDNSNAKISTYLYNDGLPSNPTIPLGSGVPVPLQNKVLNTAQTNNNYFIQAKTDINLIEIPQTFYGIKVQPGSLTLKIYVTGTLVAEASDIYKNTKIIQTSSSYNSALTGSEIGTILYDEGIILLTGSNKLANTSEYYIQPVSYIQENGIVKNNLSTAAVSQPLSWTYFGSHKVTTTNGATSTPIISASYELNFKGSTEVNTITMFCTADKNKLTWSNNRTFISGGQINALVLGETGSITVGSTTYTGVSSSIFLPSNGQYFENDQILIKNTISSSFTNYSAMYDPQIFISEIAVKNEDGDIIAIAKLANPVRKTKDMDYTFKLKLDV
jgi:hypothetical protein